MDQSSAHSRPFETFEAIGITALIAGLLLGFFLPLPLSSWFARPVSLGIGAVLAGAAVALITVTRRQFRQARQPTDPGQPTTRLITSGVFAWSRNPLYLAGMLFYLGLALLLDSLWLLLLAVPLVAAIHFLLIRPEERYLGALFGEPYRQYCRSVRRWLGRAGDRR